MNVASLENCRELHELSGWGESTFCYKTVLTGDELEFRAISLTKDADVGANARFLCPAYDLGYLMRKLEGYDVSLSYSNQWRRWTAWGHDNQYSQHADTPEDAVCKLAIELFKQNILTKEEQ